MVAHHVVDDYGWSLRTDTWDASGVDVIVVVGGDQRLQGRALPLHIRTGPDNFVRRNDSGFVYTGDLKHLDYWSRHSLPVVLVLCDAKTGACYWSEVTHSAVTPHRRSWSLVVPETNRLDEAAQQQLAAIADAPQHGDIVTKLVGEHLRDNAGDSVRFLGGPERSTHFRRFPYLIEQAGECYAIQIIYTDCRPASLESIAEELIWWQTASRESGLHGCGLQLFVVGTSADAVEVSSEARAYVSDFAGADVTVLLYRPVPPFTVWPLGVVPPAS
jgi:hypothetical protein